jgi:tripartite-type tricarboxylate transporter receptor subunit TctC
MKKLFLLFFAIFQFALVWAQSDFPNKPVTIVVATPAGGATDKTVRLLVKQLQTKWKNGVVVENRVGASGNIAWEGYVSLGIGNSVVIDAFPPRSVDEAVPYAGYREWTPINARWADVSDFIAGKGGDSTSI